MARIVVLYIAATAACAASALAQSVPDYGLTWRTIGDPGNPGAQPSDYMFLDRPVGSVAYEYRMTDTELTNGQWIEFLNAYCQANPNINISNPSLSGLVIQHSGSSAADPGWSVDEVAATWPAQVGWLYAARYANWLNNGKAITHDAFENGAYDLSTFVWQPDNSWTGQTIRAAGSRYWIPNIDEWDKAMHWDPNKQGPGQGGYWLYPNSQDTVPVGGLPGTDGAETSAYENCPVPYLPVRSYPDQRSPWGLLDGSGGANESLDGWEGIAWTRGAALGQDSIFNDRLDVLGADWPVFWWFGIRIASAVPPCGSADFNADGDIGTDADIEAFFACIGGSCCQTCGSADFNGDGDSGTDDDIEAFFRVLAGGTC